MKRHDYHARMKEVKAQYEVTSRMVKALFQLVGELPDYLQKFDLKIDEMRSVEAELHDLYFLRMFATFESIVRHYWRSIGRDSSPPMRQLVSAVAARRRVPKQTIDVVQEVRAFRNYVVHEETGIVRRLHINDVSRDLNRYVSCLPLIW